MIQVFKILVDVPIPDLKNDSTRSSLTRFNEGTCSEIRRFVVVQSKGTCSQCLSVQTPETSEKIWLIYESAAYNHIIAKL